MYLIHKFHNLSWITEINEHFHNILNLLRCTCIIEIIGSIWCHTSDLHDSLNRQPLKSFRMECLCKKTSSYLTHKAKIITSNISQSMCLILLCIYTSETCVFNIGYVFFLCWQMKVMMATMLYWSDRDYWGITGAFGKLSQYWTVSKWNITWWNVNWMNLDNCCMM